MNSTCPGCHTSVSHAEGETEILCPCGVRFNLKDDLPPLVSPDIFQRTSAMVSKIGIHEADAVFQELRDYGETLLLSEQAEVTRAKPLTPTEPPLACELQEKTEEEPLITTGDYFPGYEIKKFMMPVSLKLQSDPTIEDPLRPGLVLLWKRVTQARANGIISIRTSFNHDSTELILTGTPVLCAKR